MDLFEVFWINSVKSLTADQEHSYTVLKLTICTALAK